MNNMISEDARLGAWVYPVPNVQAGGWRLTIGEHLDEPVAETVVLTYHEGRKIAQLYGATPRNF